MGMPVPVMDRIRMRELRATGMLCPEIAKITGWHVRTVRNHVMDVKCKVRPKWSPLTNVEVRKIRALRQQGKTFNECGAAVGRSQSVAFVQARDIYLPQNTKIADKRRRRAQRIEALFASCNRAVAEVRV